MIKILFIYFIINSIYSVFGFDIYSAHRIIGGTLVGYGDDQHICSLMNGQSHSCGASIISNKWLLTAAHCLTDCPKGFTHSPKRLHLKCGTTNIAQKGVVFHINKVIIHPLYNNNTKNADIGLIRIEDSIDFESGLLDSITLPEFHHQTPTGAVLRVVGWGAVRMNGYSTNTLRTVNVPVVDNAICAYNYRGIKNLILNQRMICAGFAQGGRDSCNGDSGGSAVYNGQLIGIVSTGNGCALRGYPGIYTRVASYRDWIKYYTGI